MQSLFNKPHNLIAVCNKTDDDKLKVGESYRVTKICVLRSETLFFLEGFPEKERQDNYNFTFFQDGKEIDVVREIKFWEPSLRDAWLKQTSGESSEKGRRPETGKRKKIIIAVAVLAILLLAVILLL